MKFLAIDYGTKNIGLAISDENALMAFRFKTILNKDLNKSINKIVQISKDESISKILVGMPLGLDQKPTQMSAIVLNFIDLLTAKLENIEIIKINETMTSKMAEKNISKSKKISIDEESARILLQDYLKHINNEY